jgi:hypothetical protein
MNHISDFIAGVGMGAGLMYVLDPQSGRRRRALARDQIIHLGHRVENAAQVAARDAGNRLQGLASGDLSVLMGGRRAVENPLRGKWSPAARALMTLGGCGLFLYGLTRTAPMACVLGTAGLALTAEGITNAGIDDITSIPASVGQRMKNIPGTQGIREMVGAAR